MTAGKKLNTIFKTALDKDASDIHVKAGTPPVLRIHRELFTQTDYPVLTPDDTAGLLNEITTDTQKEIFNKTWELDFAYTLDHVGRFRVNAYLNTGTVSMVFRLVRSNIPTIEQLGLPPVCAEITKKREGLIILTGPTGCGKSTTLAAMLNYINHTVRRNIITIEDPIEYLHIDDKSTFSQREVGIDTHSFADSLKHVFRQDPDVILVGEIRDLETIAIALTAAETGHLILTTLHTPSSYEAIDRLIDAFPSQQHQQVRLQLSTTLNAIVFQNLVPRNDKEGVVPAVEVLIATPAIQNLIREGKSYQMLNFMHSGQDVGMQTIDQSLMELYRSGRISHRECFSRMRAPETIKKAGS
jgi:twitching motility protein PilT